MSDTNPIVRLLAKKKLLIATVVIPSFVALVYFGLLASDIYVSESRFVVRSPERPSASPLGQILKGSSFSRSQDDSYTVQDFMLSRDALKALDAELKVKEAYSASAVDIFNRFAALDWDESFENLHHYYQGKLEIRLDPMSSITTLVVRAFSAEQAQAINLRLLELSEDLINKLNERGRKDMIRFATQEVTDAEKRTKAAALALAKYRNEKGVIDPEKQSQIPLQQIAHLQEELIRTKAQVMQLEKLAKDNPQLPVLRQRTQMLESEILAETHRVAGAGERSLAGKAAVYQSLVLEKEFADKMLASAMSTLEQARNDAQRQQLYLERIVQPSLPDQATEPRRLRGFLATLILSFVAYGVLTILIAGVREHRD